MKKTQNENRERKKGLAGWFENLWFYYKWHILIGALVLLFLSVATVQCLGKVDPDITVLHIGEFDVGGDRDKIIEEFGYSAADLNDNGKIDLSLAFFGLSDNTTPNRFNTELLAGEHHIYIVNDEYFEKLLISNALVPINEVLGYAPENTEGDGYGIKLKYLDLAEVRGFKNFNRNSIICLRKGDTSNKLYANNRDFFKAMIKYTNGSKHVQVDLVCIGKQNLYTSTIYDMEFSLYNIGREKDRNNVAVMNYAEQKLITNDQGVTVFGVDEQTAAMELIEGNKILLVSKEVFEFLKKSKKLASFAELGIETDGSGEVYGRTLASLTVENLTDLTETPGFKYLDKELYVCGTANIEGYTANLLKYMIEWTEG